MPVVDGRVWEDGEMASWGQQRIFLCALPLAGGPIAHKEGGGGGRKKGEDTYWLGIEKLGPLVG